MKKFQLHLDTDSINLENEIHSNNFPLKVKNLAEHCVNFLLGAHSSIDCSNIKYDKEIHDQENFPINFNNNFKNKDEDKDKDRANTQKKIEQIFQFKEFNFKASKRKFLL